MTSIFPARVAIHTALWSVLVLLAACASPERVQRHPAVSGDLQLRLVRICGAPAPIPEHVLRDPEFRVATVLLDVKVAIPDRIREVKLARTSGLPDVDESVIRTVRDWRCPWLGALAEGEEWLRLPYAAIRPGYTPIQPRYHKLWSGTLKRKDETAGPREISGDEYRSRLIRESNVVEGQVRRPFGVAFSFRTPDLPFHEVPYTYLWTLPEPGIPNPLTGKLSRHFEDSSVAETNKASLLSWSVTEEAELLAGEYTLEIFVGGDRIALETFTMVPTKYPERATGR